MAGDGRDSLTPAAARARPSGLGSEFWKAFRVLGLFVRPGFLGRRECRALLRAAGRARSTKARVYKVGARVYDSDRRCRVVSLPDAGLDARIAALREPLSAHFSSMLGPPEPLEFLHYDAGDYFRIHRDRADDRRQPLNARRRRVSIVIFLTDSAEGSGLRGAAHTGGSLILYDLLGRGPRKSRGLAFPAREGMLVAFDSRLPHEVEVVKSGCRDTIVTWFPAARRRGKGPASLVGSKRYKVSSAA